MAKSGFSMTFDPETTACARGKDMRCSPKHSRNIVRAIKGMKVGAAKQFLTEVTELKTAVPMTVRNRKIHHRRGEMGSGAFPEKAAGRVLDVLTNAEANAEYKGLETENLRIVHASAYVGARFFRFRPRAQGRATAFNETATNLEIVLAERPDLDELDAKKAERRAGTGRGKGKSAKATKQTASKESASKEQAPKKAAPKKEKAEAKSEAKPAETPADEKKEA